MGDCQPESYDDVFLAVKWLGYWAVPLVVLLAFCPTSLGVPRRVHSQLLQSGMLTTLFTNIDVSIGAFFVTAWCCAASAVVPGVHDTVKHWASARYFFGGAVWACVGLAYFLRLTYFLCINQAGNNAIKQHRAKSAIEVGLHALLMSWTALNYFPWPVYHVLPVSNGLAVLQFVLLLAVAMAQLLYLVVLPLRARLHRTLLGATPERVLWQTYITALHATKLPPHGHEQLFSAGPLEVKAAHPLSASNDVKTTIILRRCYDAIQKAVMASVGTRDRILIRGQTGIGKTFGFGLGSLLRELIYLMHTVHKPNLKHVVVTFPCSGGSFDAVVIDYELEASWYYNAGSNIRRLCCASSTVWIMDHHEHGPNIEQVKGVVVLIAGLGDAACPTMLRLRAKQYWLGCDVYSPQGFIDCSPLVGEVAHRRWNNAGPFPFLLQLDDNAFNCHVANVEEAARSITAADVDILCASSTTMPFKAQDACSTGAAFTVRRRGWGLDVALVPRALDVVLDDKNSPLDLHARAKVLTWQHKVAKSFVPLNKRVRRVLLQYLHATRSRNVCWWTPDRHRYTCATKELPHWTHDGATWPKIHFWGSNAQYTSSESPRGLFWTRTRDGYSEYVYACTTGTVDGSSNGNDGDGNDGGSDHGMSAVTTLIVGRVGGTPHGYAMTGDEIFLVVDAAATALSMTIEQVIEAVGACRMHVVDANVATYCAMQNLSSHRQPLTSGAQGSERRRRNALLKCVRSAAITPPETFLRGVDLGLRDTHS